MTSPDKPKPKGNSRTRHGNGTGWGGEKKGPGNGKPQQKFGAGTNAQGHSKATPAPLNRAELRRQREDAVEAHMFHLAINAEMERDQIAAGRAFMVERKEIAGAEGGPLHVVYSWADDAASE